MENEEEINQADLALAYKMEIDKPVFALPSSSSSSYLFILIFIFLSEVEGYSKTEIKSNSFLSLSFSRSSTYIFYVSHISIIGSFFSVSIFPRLYL